MRLQNIVWVIIMSFSVAKIDLEKAMQDIGTEIIEGIIYYRYNDYISRFQAENPSISNLANVEAIKQNAVKELKANRYDYIVYLIKHAELYIDGNPCECEIKNPKSISDHAIEVKASDKTFLFSLNKPSLRFLGRMLAIAYEYSHSQDTNNVMPITPLLIKKQSKIFVMSPNVKSGQFSFVLGLCENNQIDPAIKAKLDPLRKSLETKFPALLGILRPYELEQFLQTLAKDELQNEVDQFLQRIQFRTPYGTSNMDQNGQISFYTSSSSVPGLSEYQTVTFTPEQRTGLFFLVGQHAWKQNNVDGNNAIQRKGFLDPKILELEFFSTTVISGNQLWTFIIHFNGKEFEVIPSVIEITQPSSP